MDRHCRSVLIWELYFQYLNQFNELIKCLDTYWKPECWFDYPMILQTLTEKLAQEMIELGKQCSNFDQTQHELCLIHQPNSLLAQHFPPVLCEIFSVNFFSVFVWNEFIWFNAENVEYREHCALLPFQHFIRRCFWFVCLFKILTEKLGLDKP